MSSLKLVSLNVERSKHLELVLPFLEKAGADLVCLQELMERNVPQIEKLLGAQSIFAPMVIHPGENTPGVMGIGIFSPLPIMPVAEARYHGKEEDPIVDFDMRDEETKNRTIKHLLLAADIKKDDETFRIATTHFTWTPDGSADDAQREDVARLLAILKPLGDLVLCGDFNAPRGGEIFAKLASVFKDNVPLTYTTSIDGAIHRAGQLPHMVDGMFSTSAYQVSDVRMEEGVSDHKALIATITKTS